MSKLTLGVANYLKEELRKGLHVGGQKEKLQSSRTDKF